MTQSPERAPTFGQTSPYEQELPFMVGAEQILSPRTIEPLPGTGTGGVETLADAVDASPDTLGVEPDFKQLTQRDDLTEIPQDKQGVVSRGFTSCNALMIRSGERIFFGHVWPGRTNIQRSITDLRARGVLDGNEEIVVVRGSASSTIFELDELVGNAGPKGKFISVETGRSWWTLGLDTETGALRIARTEPERGVLVYDTPISKLNHVV